MDETLSLALRVRRWRCRLMRKGRGMLGLNRTIYVEQRVGEYRAYWERAAQTLSATFIPLSETVWEIRLNGCSTRVASHVVPLDDPVTHRLAGDRAFCYRTAQQRN